MATPVEVEIKYLKNVRKNIKSTLTRFQTFLEKFTDNKLSQLAKRIEEASKLLSEFVSTQLRLETLDESESNSEEIAAFEKKYYDIMQSALDLSKSKEQNSNGQGAQVGNLNVNRENENSGKFPTIELIKFYGDFDKWPQFRDLFSTLIHDDPKLTKVRKFYYLIGSLKGSAERILSGIPITNENYDVAWNLLKDRYENEALTLKNHVKALFEPPAISEKYKLRSLKDDFQFRYRAIESLGEPVESWDALLIHLLTSKLDKYTDERWEEFLITNKIKKPKLDDLLDFLTDRCCLAETFEQETSKFKHNNESRSFSNNPKAHDSYQSKYKANRRDKTEFKVKAFISTENKCPFCSESHLIYQCANFKSLPVPTRLDEVKKLNMCLNCLRTNHVEAECKAQGCKVCAKRHNTLLHVDSVSSSNNVESALTCSSGLEQLSQILLSTAVVSLKNVNGNWIRCRALLDSGAQSNFIKRSLFEKLHLPSQKINLPITGVGGTSTSITERVRTSLSSTNSNFITTLNFLIIDEITTKIPNFSFSKGSIGLPDNIALADPDFNISRGIDVLIGAEIFYSLLQANSIKLGTNSPILQNSHLGWLLSGPYNPRLSSPISCNIVTNSTLEEFIERFWKIEDIENIKRFSDEELKCEDNFKKPHVALNVGDLKKECL